MFTEWMTLIYLLCHNFYVCLAKPPFICLTITSYLVLYAITISFHALQAVSSVVCSYLGFQLLLLKVTNSILVSLCLFPSCNSFPLNSFTKYVNHTKHITLVSWNITPESWLCEIKCASFNVHVCFSCLVHHIVY